MDTSEDYARIKERLLAALREDERAGGDRAATLPLHRRLIEEHDTRSRKAGAPCDTCGQPWPCGYLPPAR